ncbi:MAG: Hint domain-containing protein, partial [Candidatus Krumholzibacteria bacterium]|nr:Hint domain-containing protein [Candidatus Krumholzibacteria bacterium]
MKTRRTITIAILVLGTSASQSLLPAQAVGGCFQCSGNPNSLICVDSASGWAICFVTPQSCTVWGACGGGRGCFIGGTPVQTPGGEVAIEELREGDRVIGRNADGKITVNEVVRTYHTLAVAYLVINGELSVTGTHPFLVGSNWVEAGDLRVGDTLVRSDGTTVLIDSVEPIGFGVRAYNITVSGNHTFFADGILVHNKG